MYSCALQDCRPPPTSINFLTLSQYIDHLARHWNPRNLVMDTTATLAGSQSSSIGPTGQHRMQQANPSSSTSSSLPSTPSPASHPTSPSSSPSVSSLVQSPAVPTPQTTPGKIRRCWDKVSTIATWVAIAFTIASFVRDYLDVTKDSSLSAHEKWELQNDFRLSCEYDRRAGLHSDACDLALSKPASPPPGVSKRALHEHRALQDVMFVDYIFQWFWPTVVLGTAIASIAFYKAPSHSCEQQYITCPDRPSSTSRKEQDAVRSRPSDQPRNKGDGKSPITRDEIVLGFMTSILFFAQLAFILSLVKHIRLIKSAYESESTMLTVLEILSALWTLLLCYTSVKLRRILMRQLCIF